jgi:hypothetical protein
MEGMSPLFREPERDPVLGAALRQLEDASTPADAGVLRRRILTAARPTLARLGSASPPWWEWISRWNRIALPLGLAASIGAGILVLGNGGGAFLANSNPDLESDSTLVLAAFSEPAAGSELTGYLIAPEANDWLLQQAVGQ